MASAQSVERINVFVESAADSENTSLFRVASDTTVSEVKRLWETEHDLPENSIVTRADGTRLQDHLQISEIESLSMKTKTIMVLIEEAINLRVGLYKCAAEDMKSISVGLSSKPADLHPHLRDLFHLGDDRYFRLISHVMPLMYDRTFEHQDLESGSSIFVDLGYEFDVTDEWTSALTKHFAYASEKAAELLTDDKQPQKISLDGKEVNIHHDIHNVLPDDYRKMRNVIVHHQQPRSISLLVNEFMRQRLVWPTDAGGRLIENSPPLKLQDVFFEDERLQTDASMRQLRLPNHAFVHTKSTVTVKLSHGKRKVVDVATMATVGDLEAAVCSLEGTSLFMLTSGGRRLKSHETLKAVSDGSVEVERTGDTVVVHLSDRSVRFPTEQRKLCFTDLMRKVAEKGGVKLKTLVRTPLECDGCGRRLCLEEEAFQTVPSNCCRVRSLILADATPTKRNGRGVQTRWKRQAAGTETPRRRTRGRGVQTRWKRQAAGTETPRRRTRGVAQQTASGEKASAKTQHPPPAPRPRPFFVDNQSDIGERGRFSTDLLLVQTPTAGQVRKAVAARLAVSPEVVGLARVVGHRRGDGLKVFDVGDETVYLFANSEGREIPEKDVKYHLKRLNDADPFFLVPGRRNFIVVVCHR